MSFDGGTAPRFTVGTAIRTGLAVVSQNFFRFGGIVLAVAIPAFLLVLLLGAMLASGTETGGLGGSFRFASHGRVLLFFLLLGLVGAVAYFLIQGAVTYATLQTLRGRGATLRVGACLAQALNALPRLILAGLVLFLVGVAIAAVSGMVFGPLIRGMLGPGGPAAGNTALVGLVSLATLAITFYILILVWVFVPAVVAERAGPVACFGRSLTLTKGRRWTVFGILLLVFIANLIATAITKLLMQAGAPLGGAVLNLLVAVFFTVFSGVLSAIGYAALRAEKEGAGIDDVVQVFD